MAQELNQQNFDAETAAGTVVVDFWASWCGPCRMLAPVIDEIAAERADLKVCKVNIDDEPSLAQRFSVMSIPTVVCLKNGAEAARSVGLVSKEKLLANLGL